MLSHYLNPAITRKGEIITAVTTRSPSPVQNYESNVRSVGDETIALVIGQGHDRAVELAENIREKVGQLKCEYKGVMLPKVTASIGVATAPLETRTIEIENAAEARKRAAKEVGKNRVIYTAP